LKKAIFSTEITSLSIVELDRCCEDAESPIATTMINTRVNIARSTLSH